MKRVVFLGAALGAVLMAGSAAAAGLIEKNFWLSGPNYEGRLPACGEAAVEAKIRARFSRREAGYWHSDLSLGPISHTREVAYRPWGKDFIPRRFCSARVVTSDGHKRSLYYEIAEDQGIIGATWGVRWCVTGLDRHNAFAPGCSMALP